MIWWFNSQIQIESQNQSACTPLLTEHFCATSIPPVDVRHCVPTNKLPSATDLLIPPTHLPNLYNRQQAVNDVSSCANDLTQEWGDIMKTDSPNSSHYNFLPLIVLHSYLSSLRAGGLFRARAPPQTKHLPTRLSLPSPPPLAWYRTGVQNSTQGPITGIVTQI